MNRICHILVLIFLQFLISNTVFSFPTQNEYKGLAWVDADVKLSNNSEGKNFWANKPSAKWPRGQVPYVISSEYTSNERSIIRQAMSEWERKTCIRFVQRNRQADYVEITPRDGRESYCYSYVGRNGGRQIMKMFGECIRHAAMIHELGHVIGFNHEHQRPDRDDFITVHLENVEKEYHFAFDKFTTRQVDNMGTKFDYKSVMHYPYYAFSRTRDTRKPSMTDKSGSIEPIRREAQQLSDIDIQKTKLYYNNCS